MSGRLILDIFVVDDDSTDISYQSTNRLLSISRIYSFDVSSPDLMLSEGCSNRRYSDHARIGAHMIVLNVAFYLRCHLPPSVGALSAESPE